MVRQSTKTALRAYGWVLPALLLSNAALLLTKTPWLILPAAALLYGFLPGFLLVGLVLGSRGSIHWLEHIVLSGAASYMLSTITVLVVHFLPGPLTLTNTLVPLTLTTLILLLLTLTRGDTAHPPQKGPKSSEAEICLLLVLLILIIAFRFFSLDYSEYQGDETDATEPARLIIAGQSDAPFLQRKGPTQLIVAASFALFRQDWNEFGLRFPFALASGLAILGTYALGRRIIGTRWSFVGAALLAINGVFLSLSRMVHFPGVVSLILVSAVICYYLLNQEADPHQEPRLGVLGLALFGFGLLSHYDAALIGLVLAYLYLDKHPMSQWKWQTQRPLIIATVAVALVLLAYYVPFVTHPNFTDTLRKYMQNGISPERAPYNNLSNYLATSTFYNSIYYEAVLALGLLVAAAVSLREQFKPMPLTPQEHKSSSPRLGVTGHPLFPWVIWMLYFIGLVGSAVVPSWLQVGNFPFSLFLVLPAAVVLTFNRSQPIGLRTLFLWFNCYVFVYAFLLRKPGLHFYCLFPAWVLLAAWGVGKLGTWSHSFVKGWAIALGAIVLGAILLYHPYMLVIKTSPEYALSYPEHRNVVYWNTLTDKPGRFFGLPHRSGWKGVGYLFSQAILQGDYRSNEKEEIVNWYLGKGPSEAERPTYYFISDNPTLGEEKQDYPKELLASAYREIGNILMYESDQRLHIYQLAPIDKNIGDYYDRDLAPLYDQVIGLSLPEQRREAWRLP